ncbi:two-component system, OmpR family, sensor kinase [Streptomyces sp. yr375]|uniref:sensor histidine kinase n=1 Tax=Streptomyces sp. yr375 TaxID=1761906 RepID=UPI0008D3676B|nr:HAMP domain-containing sensor histidine kinase [Streptomyces sp. yr375]SES49549.1 two-component system, OmpR family, sensor kinase [Streptomyces sp. yr375]
MLRSWWRTWWRNRPLRTRISILLIALFNAVLTVTSIVVFTFLRSALYEELDHRLTATTAGMAAGDSVGLEIAGSRAAGYGWAKFGGDLYIALLSGDQRPRGPGPRYPDPPPPAGTPVTVPGDAAAAHAQYRLVTARLADGRTAVAAVDTASTEAAVRRAVQVVVAVQLLADVVLGVLGVLAVRRSLRPLEDAARTADRVAAGDFAPRLVDARVAPKTEVGRLADALNRMLDQIHAALAARDTSEERLRQFVADASHELRTPLQSIRGYGELYQRGALPDTRAVDEAVERMLAEVHRMTRLVESLLMLARFDEDDPDDLEPVDLSRVVTDSCRDAAAVEPTRPWTVTVAPDVTVWGDEAQLRGVVANLLANVRMHTPPEAACAVGLTVVADQAVLQVRDEGPGIPADALPHVFDRFYRADKSRSRARGGSGLGLSIVAAIADLHGGTVHVQSPPDGGTLIEVTLPTR